MGRQQERQQSKNFDDQQKVLNNLLTSSQDQQVVLTNMLASSKATATTLTDLQSTTETMSDTLKKEVSLFYDIDVTPTFDQGTKRLTLTNNGRTNIVWFGYGAQTSNIEFTSIANLASSSIGNDGGRTISPASNYAVGITPFFASTVEKLPKGYSTMVPFELYVTNERREEFILHCYFGVTWDKDVLTITTQLGSIKPEHFLPRLKKAKPR
jgi:hypothetical protein